MIWLYEIPTGRWCDDHGKLLTIGFSGNMVGYNNTLMEAVKGVGPCPAGLWSLELIKDENGNACDHTTAGGETMKAPVFRLVPDPTTDAQGREGLLVHGGKLSEGCIVIQYEARSKLQDGDKVDVVEKLTPPNDWQISSGE